MKRTPSLALEEADALLVRVLPMLSRLGDFIGNGPLDSTRPDSLGTRCDLIGDIKDFLNIETGGLTADERDAVRRRTAADKRIREEQTNGNG